MPARASGALMRVSRPVSAGSRALAQGQWRRSARRLSWQLRAESVRGLLRLLDALAPGPAASACWRTSRTPASSRRRTPSCWRSSTIWVPAASTALRDLTSRSSQSLRMYGHRFLRRLAHQRLLLLRERVPDLLREHQHLGHHGVLGQVVVLGRLEVARRLVRGPVVLGRRRRSRSSAPCRPRRRASASRWRPALRSSRRTGPTAARGSSCPSCRPAP